ncbi:archease [Candidatus Auribacterota bacterium]
MLKEIAHTADIGIEIQEKNLNDIFITAGHWLIKKLVEVPENDLFKQKKQKISLNEADLADLLVAFLNEIIYYFSGEKIILNHFEITNLTETKLSLSASAIDMTQVEKIKPKTEIKAATYHKLSLEKENNLWKAIVFFDL